MPLIAEIIGVSGAGKSTLSETLNDGGEKQNIRAGITVWGLPLSMLLVSAFLSLPTLFLLCVERRRFRADEIKQVIRLNAFYRRLKKESGGANGKKSSCAALFLDEGIVFGLAKLRADSFGDAQTHGRFMSRWEDEALDRWSKVLDAVVWLDAPDSLLIERIRTRAKKHRMKYKPDDEICQFLARYRVSYEQIITELKSRRSRMNVIKFRTDDASLDWIANQIFRFIKQAS